MGRKKEQRQQLFRDRPCISGFSRIIHPRQKKKIINSDMDLSGPLIV